MKIFNKNEKVNFVDEKNVFVGYDLAQDCCEYACWTITDSQVLHFNDLDSTTQTLETESDWVFDPKFFLSDSTSYDGMLEDGGCATFKLVNGTNTKYLHIFNSHNGYYAHGFEVNFGDGLITKGYL